MSTPGVKARREQLNIRASATQRETIDRAAKIRGRTRTDFILDAAMRDAEEVLLDQRVFRLSADQFDRFCELLDHPPAPNAKLRELMRQPDPWE
jgi:uncharacterized protein (DUF1778 family)